MKSKLLGIVLAIIVSVVRCYAEDAAKPGEQFVGTWDKVSGEGVDTIVIEDNGPQFLITKGTQKIGAVAKDGFLMIGDSSPVTHVESSDHITLTDGSEYSRRSPADLYMKKMFKDEIEHRQDEALADLNIAIKLDPKNMGAYFGRGSLYLFKGDFDNAIADYGEMLKLDPNKGDARFMRGSAYFQKGDYPRSIDDFSILIRSHPSYPYPYEQRGKAEYAAGSNDDALVDLQMYLAQTLTKTPANSDDMHIHYFIWLIEVEKNKQVDAANTELTSFLKRFSVAAMDWPRPIGDYLLGSLSEDSLLTLANVGTPEKIKQQLCEANFYLGTKHLLTGDANGAKALFQKSIETKETAVPEYQCAKARLDRLAAMSK